MKRQSKPTPADATTPRTNPRDSWPSWTDHVRVSLGPAAKPIRARQVPRNRPRGFRS